MSSDNSPKWQGVWAARDVERAVSDLGRDLDRIDKLRARGDFRRYFHFSMVWKQIAYSTVDRWIAPAVQRLFSAG
jgi:hypothetical protein